MFESAELGQQISKSDFQAQVPQLREELVRLQYELRNADFPVIVQLTGDDAIGVRGAVNRLAEWTDPRFLHVEVFREATGEERDFPRFWRFWRRLPPRGRIGVLANGWTLEVIVDQLDGGKTDELRLERMVRHNRSFEEALVADGALLLRFWVHLPKQELKKRLKAAKEDAELAWQVGEADRRIYEHHEEAMAIAQRVMRLSDGRAPWQVIESTDARYRDLTLARQLRAALAERLESEARNGEASTETEPPASTSVAATESRTLLDAVDLSASVSEKEYEKELPRLQGRLARASREAFDRGVSTVLVFQGWDAAGKGGTIRRLTAAIDASIVRVMPIAAPSDEELAHHYLWRFWRRLPRKGRVRVFDRSWYERVLVERVEGFASREAWRRSYAEINDFEEQLCEHGFVLLKFWLHIDADEQLRRFRAREATPFKRFKITPDDWRNRERWGEYEHAVNEMISRTHSPEAPWHLVAANNKRHARLAVLRAVCDRLEEEL